MPELVPNPDIARPQPLTEPRQDFLEWYASWLAER
jgi:hypothetical protein